MKFWRSYDGTTTLAWFCTIALVASLREVSLADGVFVVQPYRVVVVAAVALMVLALYLGRRMRLKAEDKVRRSEPILLSDIRTLAKSNSRFLNGAIALRNTQMEQGEVQATGECSPVDSPER